MPCSRNATCRYPAGNAGGRAALHVVPHAQLQRAGCRCAHQTRAQDAVLARGAAHARPGVVLDGKGEPFRFCACVLGSLARAGCLPRGKAAQPHSAVVQEHDKLALPRERRGLAHGDGLPREEPAHPGLLAAGCIPATRARRGARGERRQAARPAGHGGPRARGGVPCNERAQDGAAVGQRDVLAQDSGHAAGQQAATGSGGLHLRATAGHELPDSIFCQRLVNH